ncbi:MAG: hypothetical protein AAGJ80_11070, partial [Cyanobacteria bacterium J06553_1]
IFDSNRIAEACTGTAMHTYNTDTYMHTYNTDTDMHTYNTDTYMHTYNTDRLAHLQHRHRRAHLLADRHMHFQFQAQTHADRKIFIRLIHSFMVDR